jgi:hypothetical protein
MALPILPVPLDLQSVSLRREAHHPGDLAGGDAEKAVSLGQLAVRWRGNNKQREKRQAPKCTHLSILMDNATDQPQRIAPSATAICSLPSVTLQSTKDFIR